MNCHVCGRALREDSRYCDFCGASVIQEFQAESGQKSFDTPLLLKWLFISLAITVIITLVAHGAGIPLLFGGLFLPFFFRRKEPKA